MNLYLDRSRSAMIYPLERSWLGLGVNINRIISELISKVFIILHFYYNYSHMISLCLGHPLFDLSHDQQLSGLRPLS